jgi:hypothetical protein
MLEKEEEDKWAGSREKLRSITYNQGQKDIMCRNGLLIEGMRRKRRRRRRLLDDLEKIILKFERERTRSHSLENLLWNRLWFCPKTDYVFNE